MKVKTSELSGAPLDWAVAQITKPNRAMISGAGRSAKTIYIPKRSQYYVYAPSSNWKQGGPIIEREQLCVGYKHQLDSYYVPVIDPSVLCWARTTAGGHLKYGPTPLIAAMRCYVASKLGDEIEIPEELCQGIQNDQ